MIKKLFQNIHLNKKLKIKLEILIDCSKNQLYYFLEYNNG